MTLISVRLNNAQQVDPSAPIETAGYQPPSRPHASRWLDVSLGRLKDFTLLSYHVLTVLDHLGSNIYRVKVEAICLSEDLILFQADYLR